MKTSFIEQCILALPAEEQPAARQAFAEVAEGGGDSVFAKVLVTLRATGAYFEKVPQAVSESGEKLLREVDVRVEQLARERKESEGRLEERLRRMIADQAPKLGEALALDRVVENLESQSAEIGRLNRSVARMRRARFSGLLLLMTLAFAGGAATVAGVFRSRYEQGQRADRIIRAMNSDGVFFTYERTLEGGRVEIEGNALISGQRKVEDGKAFGATLVFSAPRR